MYLRLLVLSRLFCEALLEYESTWSWILVLLTSACNAIILVSVHKTRMMPHKQATAPYRRTLNMPPDRSMQICRSLGLLPRPGVKKRDNSVSRDATPSAPNGAQPPLTEAAARSHRSPVFHLATIDESGDIVSAKAGIERVEPSFFRQGVVDCLCFVHVLGWAHGLYLRAWRWVCVYGVEHRLRLAVGVAWRRWLHAVWGAV